MEPMTRGSHLPPGCFRTTVYRQSWAVIAGVAVEQAAADPPVDGSAWSMRVTRYIASWERWKRRRRSGRCRV